jgi:hypothetical protein
MGQVYSVNIDIGVSFVEDLNENQIKNLSERLENAIRETLTTRITTGTEDIKIRFSKK